MTGEARATGRLAKPVPLSQRGQTLLKGHALRNEGYRTDSAPPGFANHHLAECECGAFSPAGLSIRQRKQWHREHKQQQRSAG